MLRDIEDDRSNTIIQDMTERLQQEIDREELSDYDLTSDTNLAEIFGDTFDDIKTENPYFSMDYEMAAMMNTISEPD
jgi:hypothetical protein